MHPEVMNFADRVTRHPIAFDPDRAAEALKLFADQPPELRAVLEGTGGCSPYLLGLMTREDEWLHEALARPPEEAFEATMEDVSALAPDALSVGLRRAKRRAALLIALCDLSGVWPLASTTGALTRFADHCVDTCLKHLVRAEIGRGKLPGLQADDADTAGGMVALAMGKQGAYELNYSSDIDLIVLFDQDRFERDDFHEARAGFVKVTRRMTSLMSDATGEGYVFRTDLRLRPDASVTPVCIAMEAAERYYESLGRTWERAAHIKARAASGDLAAGAAYLERLRPFVWRKHLDFAAIQDAHDMRLKIRDHKGLHGDIDLNGHNMKLGKGGIREIEFFTQTRQLIAGGRDPDLQVRGTVEGLSRLADKGWVPRDVADALTAHYRLHRDTEHRLQMIADAQTHSLPNSDDGFDRLARFMGEGDTEAFKASLRVRLAEVQELCEGFFSAPEASTTLETPDWADAITSRWSNYPALRSERAVELFARLKPELLRRMEATGRPEETLSAFDGFLAGLPAGVQLFSLFNSNPQLIDIIVDISSTAPDLALYLSRNSDVLDAVIGGDFFTPWPGAEALTDLLAAQLEGAQDYERQLDVARRWKKEWHFRIGVHLLRALIGTDEASAQYADLAQAVLAALWPCVVTNFAEKHGPPPGRGAAVLGMGSLGAARLGPRSDLDLIVIYDADGVEASDGRRPLAARAYYARLTQALITALTAPMAEGRLYEVDMRLRPSGNQGPVATSFQAFQTYQRDEAWTWEHLALTRARPLAGSRPLGSDIERFRRQLLVEKADLPKIAEGVIDMRLRLAEAKPAKGLWDGKLGTGRGQDIELLSAAAALAAGSPATRTTAQLQAAQKIGLLSRQEAGVLRDAYALTRRIEIAGKLITDKPLQADELSARGLAFLLRAAGQKNPATLDRQIETLQSEASAVITTALDRAKVAKNAKSD